MENPAASSTPAKAFVPTLPTSVKETGLGLGFLTELAIKHLYFEGSLSGYQLAERMMLPYPGVVEQILEFLKREKLCEVKGSGGFAEAAYQYAIADKGRGVARVQRLAQGAKGAESPNNVGGRRAFPPRVDKDWSLKVNQKERVLAKLSALAATADAEKVKARGHQFDEALTLPVVIEDRLEEVRSTSEVLQVLKSIGVSEDVVRSKEGIRVRAGRGKMRGRRYRMPRSLLIVVSSHDVALVKGARNLPGVEVAFAEALNPGMLAPGGLPGRLTVFSESALKKIGEW